ncbi:MAG: adenylyl-sulfate kinase [Prosthecobacter sp.]
MSREDRWRLLGQRGGLVWFTGLSGSGKSTLAAGLDVYLHRLRPCQFCVGWDNLRHGLCRDLGFSAADRAENIRRAGEVACLMAEAGLIVICALISPFTADRQFVRESCKKKGVSFFEIYVNAPLAVCENRDPKGLYRKARQGKIKGFTGIDSPYELPQKPELELRMDLHSLEVCLKLLAKCILDFNVGDINT